jgi:acetoin utilization protein AcuB
MRARDVMTTRVLSVTSNTPAPDAVQLMREKRIHHLLVKDGSARIGIVSDRDLGGRQAPRATREKTVGDGMTPHVVSVDANATPRQIANVMRGRSIGCVIVTERGRTVGLITVSDLLDLLGRGAANTVSKAQRRDLHHRTPHRQKALPNGLW